MNCDKNRRSANTRDQVVVAGNSGAATADLTAIFEGGLVVDRIEAPNMTIDGYSFTGDEVNLYLGAESVDLTGANSESASAGLFYGPIDDVLGVPSQYGAVAMKQGDDDAIWLYCFGDATGSTDVVPAEERRVGASLCLAPVGSGC